MIGGHLSDMRTRALVRTLSGSVAITIPQMRRKSYSGDVSGVGSSGCGMSAKRTPRHFVEQDGRRHRDIE